MNLEVSIGAHLEKKEVENDLSQLQLQLGEEKLLNHLGVIHT